MTKLDDAIRESSMEDLWNIWFSELHKKSGGITLKIKKILYSGQSDFQQVDVFETATFGRVLVLYGSIMITEKDEFVYHEMISHVPLSVHPAVKRVLVIGGGDGGTVREIVKHPRVERVVLVEIDKMVVDVCKEFFPGVSSEFSNLKVEVRYDDGAKFVAEAEEKFDLIIVDSSDPIGPAEVLFQKPFHQHIYDKLNDDGILISQTESPFFHQETIRSVYKNLRGIFPVVEAYTASIPTYPSGLWSFAFCSKKYHPLKDLNKKYFAELKLATRYYNTDVHEGAFKLPNFVRDLTE
jgi:spermidine synthase